MPLVKSLTIEGNLTIENAVVDLVRCDIKRSGAGFVCDANLAVFKDDAEHTANNPTGEKIHLDNVTVDLEQPLLAQLLAAATGNEKLSGANVVAKADLADAAPVKP